MIESVHCRHYSVCSSIRSILDALLFSSFDSHLLSCASHHATSTSPRQTLDSVGQLKRFFCSAVWAYSRQLTEHRIISVYKSMCNSRKLHLDARNGLWVGLVPCVKSYSDCLCATRCRSLYFRVLTTRELPPSHTLLASCVFGQAMPTRLCRISIIKPRNSQYHFIVFVSKARRSLAHGQDELWKLHC